MFISFSSVWSDSRTSKLCSELEEKVGSKDYFREACGLPISTYFSAMKLRWLIDNSKEVQVAIREDRYVRGRPEIFLLPRRERWSKKLVLRFKRNVQVIRYEKDRGGLCYTCQFQVTMFDCRPLDAYAFVCVSDRH